MCVGVGVAVGVCVGGGVGGRVDYLEGGRRRCARLDGAVLTE